MATHSPAAFTADDVLDLPLPNGISGHEFIDAEDVVPGFRLRLRGLFDQ